VSPAFVQARYVASHIVRHRFRDGTSGEIDLANALRSPILELLRNPGAFSQFHVHPEFHTLAWPNGHEFAPELLRDNGGTEVTEVLRALCVEASRDTEDTENTVLIAADRKGPLAYIT
jgi:hypothetical protein